MHICVSINFLKGKGVILIISKTSVERTYFRLIKIDDRAMFMLCNMKCDLCLQRTIDVVKVDIEGDEWKVLPELFQSGELQRVRQICIEIHFGRVVPNLVNYTTHWGNVTLAAQLKVLRQLHHEGFRIFMREHNTYRVQYFEKPFREITNVNELSLVNIHLEYGTKDFDYSRTFGDKTSNFDVIR